jgi:hypothetical protein
MNVAVEWLTLVMFRVPISLQDEQLNEMYSSPNIVRVLNREELDGRGM